MRNGQAGHGGPGTGGLCPATGRAQPPTVGLAVAQVSRAGRAGRRPPGTGPTWARIVRAAAAPPARGRCRESGRAEGREPLSVPTVRPGSYPTRASRSGAPEDLRCTLPARACELTLIAWRLGALSRTELWCRYIGLGGNHPLGAFGDLLDGTAQWPAGEHNVLAQVLNERLWDVGCGMWDVGCGMWDVGCGMYQPGPHRQPEDDRRSISSQAG
jgi:hypothetical protein